MKKLNAVEMRKVEGGIWHGKGAYHCSACFLTAFGAGIAYLFGFRL